MNGLCPGCLEILEPHGVGQAICTECRTVYKVDADGNLATEPVVPKLRKGGLAEALALAREPVNEGTEPLADITVAVVPDGKAQYRGTVTKVEWRDTKWGRQAKATVRDGAGGRVWGTVPKDLITWMETMRLTDASTLTHEQYVVARLKRSTVTIDADFARQDHDFAFFNRAKMTVTRWGGIK
jgi:hypothetical protein